MTDTIEKKKVITYKEMRADVDKNYKWTGNILRLYAEQLFLYPTKEEEIIRTDMTDKYLKEIEREIKMGEIVKQQINAKPRMAKSTLGIKVGMFMDSLLKKYYPEQCSKSEFGMRNIARDDQEYTKKMRNPDLMFDVIVVDENNALEQTGENATTEQAQKEVFTDIQAGRYVHTVYICPEGDMDRNSDIKLEIRNREKGFIHSYLYYKLKGSWILLGYVDIDVKDLIERWERVKSRFYKFLKYKHEDDRKFVEYWSKKDRYVEYMIKKYEKMELMNREGILRPRELDYASIVLNVTSKTKGLVKIMSLTQLRLPVQSYVEMEFKRQKIPVSLIGIDMTTRRVMGVLTMFKTYEDICNKMVKYKGMNDKNKISKEQYEKVMEELCGHATQIWDLIQIQMKELQRYEDVNKKYNSHLEDKKEETVVK